MAIPLFFVGHWYLALFFQTFFLHRYASHRMFGMSRFWERVFYLLSYVSIGPSFFNPKAYAVMHRMHHAYTDTEKDPHAPQFFHSFFSLLWGTIKIYLAIDSRKVWPKEPFDFHCPEWESLDRIVNNWTARFLFIGLFVAFYYCFATAWWMYLLLAVHILMGGVHGTIVNWFGHKYGYENFREIRGNSKNTLPVDFITGGELLQNNHHNFPGRPNFAVRAFEFDPTYWIMKLLNWLRVIHFSRPADR